MNTNSSTFENINLAELTGKLRFEDDRYATKTKIFKYIYWIMIPVYSLLILRQFLGNDHYTDIIGSFCFLISMFIYALIFNIYHREYKTVDYSLPTLTMLKNAAKRYKPFQTKVYWLIFAILLMDLGLSFKTEFGIDLVWLQIIFIGAIIIAFAIGYVYWKSRYKPLLDSIKLLIREIENG